MNLVTMHASDGVGHIALNRTEVRNALDPALLRTLAAAVSDFDGDPQVAVILVSGNGGHFSSGADLRAPWPTTLEAMIVAGSGPRQMLADSRKPVVAAVEGTTMGGGLELALSADVVLVAEDAVLSLPEYTMGTLPVAGTVARLVAACGRQRAADLLLSGRKFDGREAVAMGLAVAAFPAEVLPDKAQDYARRIAKPGVAAAILAKCALRAAMRGDRSAHETSLAETAFVLAMGRMNPGPQ
jgi:enoyl-CoA hydratase/carnithine racemase